MTARIQAVGLSKTYRQGHEAIEVLKNLDLTLNEGETVAILGQSGSGKSTLLSLLAALDTPTQGHVQINGHDVTTMTEEELTAFRARTMGFVFQQFHLMPHLSALENIALPLEILGLSDAESKAKHLLERVGLSDRSNHFPDELSGGEKQRVAIARACVTEPSLLLADEPSGNLDPETGQNVMQIFFDLVESRRMTLILVTHNDALAERCHRRLRLANGILQPA